MTQVTTVQERAIKPYTLGLYNTYSGKELNTPLIRAVARALPLCIAYDLNLCLIDFPTNKNGLLKLLHHESTLTKVSEYLEKLIIENRLIMLKRPLKDVNSIGTFIAATVRPTKGKETSFDEILPRDKKACIVMGLGSKGLPKKFLDTAPLHLEVTGRNIGLETCTVMGIIASALKMDQEKG